MNLVGKGTSILVGISLLAGAYFSQEIVETVKAGEYHIKQEAITGDMSVHGTEGMYLQLFGDIHHYKLTGEYNKRIQVRFKDGSTADVNAVVNYRLPTTPEGRLGLHRDKHSFATVQDVLVPSAIEGTMKQTANLFGAEEVYSTRRSEFVQMFREQLGAGLYATRSGKDTNEVVKDETGMPVIAKESVLKEYNIDIINIEINDIDFDAKTDALIKARKDAEQQETLARSEAERAKQDAITAEERGKADVAKARYEALVIKEREVIEAEKRTAMEIEATKQANEQALQEKARGEAEAYSAKLKVEAGLSPREQAEIDRDTAIGVAKALGGENGIDFPRVMVFGGGDGTNSPMNPFDAVGLKAFQDMAKEATSANK